MKTYFDYTCLGVALTVNRVIILYESLSDIPPNLK